jgi:predicted DnaQ family exonuclease/DinG family helicase
MPKLFDLLSDRSDKDSLNKLKAQAQTQAALKKTAPIQNHQDAPHPPKHPLQNKEQKTEKRYEKKQELNHEHDKALNPERKNEQHKVPRLYAPDFVALDLETTGLDQRGDRVIEIGAIRFCRSKPVEEFSSLINPGIPIPANITELTGITTEAVAGSPDFGGVVDKLLDFIGNLPLCGHQVSFDFGFLNAELKRIKREPVKNRQFDTALLSRVLLDDLGSYSLSHVAKHLGVPLDNAHRALDDARASGNVACALVPGIMQLSPQVRRIMSMVTPASVLKSLLQFSIQHDTEEMESPGSLWQHREIILPAGETETLGLPDHPVPLSDGFADTMFAPAGPLCGVVENYCVREAQILMARGVVRSLNEELFYVAEAQTGTGKSFAYGLPVVHWAFTNNTRVFISTYTRNIQDQLFAKDLPLICKALGEEVRYTILKGRSNYLCKYRWRRLLGGELGNLSPQERFGILPLVRWAETTLSGDIEEQNQFNRRWFAAVWSLVCAEAQGCLGRKCGCFSECFLQNARKKALNSHVVVINHSLFFSEICADNTFLGPIGVIVFDEAHHLESSGHRQLRVEVDTNRINNYTEFLTAFQKVLETGTPDTKTQELAGKYKSIVKQIRKSGVQFLADLTGWASGLFKGLNVSENAEIFLFEYRDDPFQTMASAAGFFAGLDEVQDILSRIRQECGQKDLPENVWSDCNAGIDKTSQLKADLQYLCFAKTEEHVFWSEGSVRGAWVKLCGVPLDVGAVLTEQWGKKVKSVVFTSATLAVNGKSDYFSQRVGLKGAIASRTFFETFATPFASEQMIRCAVNGPLSPDREGYDDYVAQTVTRLMSRFQKNILVLFTSNAMLNTVYELLKKRSDFPSWAQLLVQGIGGSRATLLQQFKETKQTVLLGAASFWEGIDTPKEACEMVIIPRLPFQVPAHPLTKAISERVRVQEGDSFFRYAVPEAVIRFKQGAGRLIRTAKDRGALIVLDPRIVQKSYGKAFLNSLPGEFVLCDNAEDMLQQVGAFFKKELS